MLRCPTLSRTLIEMQSYGLGLIELSYLSLKIDKQEFFIYEKSTESCTKTHL